MRVKVLITLASVNPVKQRAQLEWKLSAPGWKKWDQQIMSGLQPASDQLIQYAGIDPGHSVLDVATGTGEPALTIARIVGPQGKVVGVDLSPEMLEVAKARAASQGLTDVSFQVNEDENLSAFQDSSFDAVVSRFGVMFMPEPIKALGGFRRVLKPGGKAAVAVWGSPERTPFLAVPMKSVLKHVPQTLEFLEFKPPPPGTPGGPFGIPSADMLRDIFTKAGFLNVNSQITEIVPFSASSAEEYWQAMSEIAGPLILVLSRLSDEKKQAIRNDAVESLRGLFPSGPVKPKGELVVGYGTKP